MLHIKAAVWLRYKSFAFCAYIVFCIINTQRKNNGHSHSRALLPMMMVWLSQYKPYSNLKQGSMFLSESCTRKSTTCVATKIRNKQAHTHQRIGKTIALDFCAIDRHFQFMYFFDFPFILKNSIIFYQNGYLIKAFHSFFFF